MVVELSWAVGTNECCKATAITRAVKIQLDNHVFLLHRLFLSEHPIYRAHLETSEVSRQLQKIRIHLTNPTRMRIPVVLARILPYLIIQEGLQTCIRMIHLMNQSQMYQ